MAIQVGDTVVDWDGEEGTVLAIAGTEAAVLFRDEIGFHVIPLVDLAIAEPRK